MGLYKNSPWGTVSQTIGDAVGSRSRGQNVVRSMPGSYNDANTLVQRQNRCKQKIKAQSLQRINSFVRSYNISLSDGQTSFSKAMTQFKHSAMSFTGATEEDTVNTLIDKVVIDGSEIAFGDGSCDSPVLDGTATWDDVEDEISQTLIDISGRTNVPADAEYQCVLISKNGVGAYVSTNQEPASTTSATFSFDSSIPSGDYIVLIGLSNNEVSGLTAYAGDVTIS